MRLLAFLLVFLPNIALGWEDWDQSTRDSFARTTNWIALDWHSTDMLAADDWNGFVELNPILGEAPSREQVGLYMLGRIGLNYWMHDIGYGENLFYQIVTVGHAFAAANNYKIQGQSDKVGHIAVGAVVSETVSYYTGSRWKGCAAALAVGIAKEINDSRTHDFDFEDAAATALGCSIIRIEF
jgi:hypothetical protein